MRTCRSCGAEMRAEARFCALCGAESAPLSSSRRLVIPLVAGLAAAVVAIGVATWLVVGREDDAETSSDSESARVASVLVQQLGSEDAATRATLRALDRGYGFEQLADASETGGLQPDGVILDPAGNELAPNTPPASLRYALSPGHPRLLYVYGGQSPHGGPAPVRSQGADQLEADLAALSRMVSLVNAERDASLTRKLGGLEFLLALARSGYSGAEIFGILANPAQKLVIYGGDYYAVATLGSDGRLPPRHIECPESLPDSACGEVQDGTRDILDAERIGEYFPGYDPDRTSNSDVPTDAAEEDEPGDEEVRTYSGKLEAFVCDNVAANAGAARSIEATVIGDVIELAFEATCHETTWVQDATTRAVTCAYTLDVDASATGIVSSNGEFSGSGTSEQRASDFHGPTCEEFAYDGSNDLTEPFMMSGRVSDAEITGFFYEDASAGQPGLPFTVIRQ